MSSLHVVHGFEYVQDLLLADTETLICVHFTCGVFVLNGDIKAAFVEVGGGLPIIEFLELLGNLGVLLQALLDIFVVFTVTFTLIVLSLFEVIAEGKEGVLVLLESCLSRTLVEALFLFKLDRRLDLARSRIRCNVEEIDIGLQITLLEESDALALGADFFLQLEIVFFAEILSTSRATHVGCVHYLLALSFLL